MCVCVHWRICSTVTRGTGPWTWSPGFGQEIILNLVIVIFPGDGTSQLLCSVIVLSVYTLNLYTKRPYDTTALNLLDLWTNVGLIVLLLFTAGFGFQSSPGKLPIEEMLGDAGVPFSKRRLLLGCLAAPSGPSLHIVQISPLCYLNVRTFSDAGAALGDAL